MSLPAEIGVSVDVPFPTLVRGSGPITLNKLNGVWTVGFDVSALTLVIQGAAPITAIETGGIWTVAIDTSGFVLSVGATAPITASKIGGIWTVGLDITDLAAQVPTAAQAATDYLAVWDSSALSFVKVSISSLAHKTVYDIRDYGAKCDGATNDVTAINAAITAASAAGGGAVWIPDGLTSIVGGASINLASNVHLVGRGTLKLLLSFNGYIVQGNGISRTGIHGVQFDCGSFAPSSSSGVSFLQNITDVVIEDTIITNMGYFGHILQIATRFRISRNTITLAVAVNTQNEGILVTAVAVSSQGKIVGNTLINTGMEIDGTFIEISNNSITNWKFGGGITTGPIASTHDLTIANNYCAGSSGTDVNATQPAGIENWAFNTVISNNVCNNNSGPGISNGGKNCAITGNVCYDNCQTGLGPLSGIFSQFASASFTGSNCIIEGNVSVNGAGAGGPQAFAYGENSSVTGNKVGRNKWGVGSSGTLSLAASTYADTDWADYTSTVTAGSGTITSVTTTTARYSQEGKTIHFQVEFHLVTNGTGATSLNVPLPAKANTNSIIFGADVSTAAVLIGKGTAGSTTLTVLAVAGGYPGVSGDFYRIAGSYEAQ